MKKNNLYFLLFLITSMFALNSCETDVNIFEEGKETTVVYGYLDVDADTNYIKITKSFIGNAVDNAPIYSNSNYDYKLDVQLIGKFADMPNIVTSTVLDTCSLYKPYNPDALFYTGVNQGLYFTTRKLLENENYKLVIKRNDGVEITSNVKTISNSSIKQPIYTIHFESPHSNKISWLPTNTSHFPTYYEVVGYFHYKQLDPGSNDTINHSVKWFMGSGTADQLWSQSDYRMSVSYTPNNLYSHLKADPNIANTSSTYVQRFVDDFEIVISATGEELYNYILIQNSTGAIQDTPEYTNVENGIGIFSSRSECHHFIEVHGRTINTLIRDYPEWGFQKLPGQ